jgi:hypothetical protein
VPPPSKQLPAWAQQLQQWHSRQPQPPAAAQLPPEQLAGAYEKLGGCMGIKVEADASLSPAAAAALGLNAPLRLKATSRCAGLSRARGGGGGEGGHPRACNRGTGSHHNSASAAQLPAPASPPGLLLASMCTHARISSTHHLPSPWPGPPQGWRCNRVVRRHGQPDRPVAATHIHRRPEPAAGGGRAHMHPQAWQLAVPTKSCAVMLLQQTPCRQRVTALAGLAPHACRPACPGAAVWST